MNCTIVKSVFFVISWLALVSGGFFYKKSEKKLVGMTWIPVIILMSTCYHTMIAAFLDLVHIPVNVVSIGILDLLAAAWFWYQIKRKKVRQKYSFAWVDAAFSVILLLTVLYLDIKHFGGTQLYINYATIDPAAHLKAAMDVVHNQSVNNMFYSALFNGLLIETFAPLTKVDYYYKIFVMGDLLNFGLAGLMFYGVVRRFLKDRFTTIAGVIVSLAYLIGYPLCSILYGFVYLGMGVTIIAMLIVLSDTFMRDEIAKRWNILFLMLGCFAIFECYVLFMPVTFFALICCIFVKQWRNKCLVSKDTVFTCLQIFLLPCILGFVFTYAGIFAGGVTVSSAISAEGACYRDMYSNFLPFLPLMLYGFWMGLKKRENHLLMFLMPFTGIFVVALFLLGMKGKVSSYYFYKNYNLLWLLVFVLMFYGITYAEKQTRVLVGTIFLTWCFVAGIYITGLEDRIQAKYGLFDPTPKSASLNDLYNFNRTTLFTPGYSYDKRELYHYVYDKLLQKGEKMVAISCFWQDDIWFQAITDQRLDGWDYASDNHTAYYNKLESSGANYIVVLYDGKLYQDNPKYYDKLEKIYENPAGFVAKLK